MSGASSADSSKSAAVMTARADPDPTPNDGSSPEDREESLVAIGSDVPRRGRNDATATNLSEEELLLLIASSHRVFELDRGRRADSGGSPRRPSHPRAPCASTRSTWACRRSVARSRRRRARMSSARVARARSQQNRRSRRCPATTTTAHPPERPRPALAVANSRRDARSSRSRPTLARRTPGFSRTSSLPRPSPVSSVP